MRLTYRGVNYESSQPSLESREVDVLRSRETNRRCQTLQENALPLTYRGVRYTTDQVAAAISSPVATTSKPLIYRGVKYVKTESGKIRPVDVMDSTMIPQNAALAFREIGKVHRENLRLNLERRLQSAKEKGDQTLVRLLEAESKELAL